MHLHTRAIFYYCIVALLLGAQLLSFGFIAEMITAQNRPNTRPTAFRYNRPTRVMVVDHVNDPP